jgi:hypothetical protein
MLMTLYEVSGNSNSWPGKQTGLLWPLVVVLIRACSCMRSSSGSAR